MKIPDSCRHAFGLCAAIGILGGCGSQQMGPPTSSQPKASAQYTIIDLGGLGGTVNDSGVAPNDRGWVAGAADTAGNRHERATLWRNGKLTDLGTFGGPNGGSSTVNNNGVVVGGAQSARRDPLGEGWGYALVCKANGGPCQGAQNLLLAFEWKNG